MNENDIAEALRNFSGLLQTGGDKAKAYAQGLLDWADNNRQQARSDFNAQGLLLGGKPVTASDIDQAMAAASFAPMGITVWHGTPHKFAPTAKNPLGEFDLSKIGTGEGNQAFGHGIYVAENPAVAREYRYIDAQIDPDQVKYAGKKLETLYTNAQAAQERAYRLPNGPIKDKAISDANAQLGFWESLMTRNHPKQVIDDAMNPENGWPERAAFAKSLDLKKFTGVDMSPGGMYKVDLPDEHLSRFLDWDKPISQQTPYVVSALRNDSRLADLLSPIEMNATTGQTIVNRLSNKSHFVIKSDNGNIPLNTSSFDEALTLAGGDPSRLMKVNNPTPDAAAENLRAIGILGTKYLDQGSRGAGNGTSNFVVFDPSILNILERQ